MFQIELSHAVALYSLILAIVIIAIWVYTELSVRRPQRSLGQQFLWQCTYCGCKYLDESAKNISQCPRCQSYNALEEEQNRPPDVRKETLSTEPDTARGARNPSHRKRHHQRRRGPRRRR